MSDQPVVSDQFVTRDEFSRLEKKIDKVLQLMEDQRSSLSSSRFASSQGREAGVYSTDDPSFKKQELATGFEKVTEKEDKTDDDEDSFIVLESSSTRKNSQTYVKEPVDSSFPSVSSDTGDETRLKTLYSHSTIEDQVRHLTHKVEQLENRLCDRLNVSMKNIMSELQKEMRQMKIQASSSQTVKKEREILKDIQNMTGSLNLFKETIEELKDQIGQVVPSDESSIIANIRNELAWFKEHVEETVKSQACQDIIEEVKAINQETQKCILTLDQDVRAPVNNLIQELQKSATVTKEQFGRILDKVNTSSTALSQNIQKSTEAMVHEVETSNQNVTRDVQASATAMTEQEAKVLTEGKTSNEHLNEEIQKAITQELDKASKDFTDKTQATATVIMEKQVEQVLQKIEASSKAFLEEAKASNTAFSQDMRKSTETITQRIDNASCSIKQEVKASVTVTPNQVDQILKEVKASNASLSQDMKISREEIKQEIDKSSKSVTEMIQDSETVMTNHFSHVMKEVNTSKTALSQSVQKSTQTLMQDLNRSQLDVVQKIQTSSSSLHKRLDQSFNDVTVKLVDSVTTSRQQAVGEIQKAVESLGQRIERNIVGIQIAVKLHDGNMEKNMAEVQRTVKTYGETMKKNIDGVQKTVESHGEAMKLNIDRVRKAVERHGETIKKDIDGVRKTVESHDVKITENTAEIQEAVKSHGETMKENIDGIQKTVESHGEKMKKNLQDSLTQQSENTRTHVDTKMTENTKQLKDNMYNLKREIFAFTEKECQIVRDRIEGPLPSHKLYTLDFYVKDFKNLIKSDVERHSPPWHINQFKSSLQGWVQFLNNGKLRVRIHYGRHPLEAGLQPQLCGKFKVKATISDRSGKLADMEVGEKTWTVNEDDIKNNGNWGHSLGDIDCQSILNAGYADIQGYRNGAVLLRYLVEML